MQWRQRRKTPQSSRRGPHSLRDAPKFAQISHEGPAPDIQWHLGWWSHAWRLEACHHPSTAKGVQGPFGPWIVSADLVDLDSVQGHGEDGYESAPMVRGGAGPAHPGPDWLPAE